MIDEILRLARDWPLEQLDRYVLSLEARLVDTQNLLRELRKIQKKKLKQGPVDTGSPRGGK